MHKNWLVFASERHQEENDRSKPCLFFCGSMQMKKLNRLKEKMELNIPSFIWEVLLPNLKTHVVPFFYILRSFLKRLSFFLIIHGTVCICFCCRKTSVPLVDLTLSYQKAVDHPILVSNPLRSVQIC